MEQLTGKRDYKIVEPEKPKGAEIINLEEEKIKREVKEVSEQFKDLIELVSSRYKNLNKEIRGRFIEHNEEILKGVIELGIKNRFSKEELKQLELSAILHDIAKADSIPEKYKDIQNYTLVMHGKIAAEEIPDILTDEKLEKMGMQGDFGKIRESVAKAILEHMGPIPGFMEDEIDEFNKKMEERGEKKIEYPKASGKISEVLLAADMQSLASSKGIGKILSLRAVAEKFINKDKILIGEYDKIGIKLGQGEAALISAFKSAFQGRDMQKDQQNWKWINNTIEDSKKGKYVFSGGEITWDEVYAKMKKYEEEKRKAEIKEQLDAA